MDKSIHIIFFSIIFFSCPPQSLFALENTEKIVQGLTQRASEQFSQGDIQKAVDDFISALNVDWTSGKARQSLKEISESGKLAVDERLELIRIEALLSNIDNLRKNLDYSGSQREILRDNMLKNGYEDQVIEEGLGKIKNIILSSKKALMTDSKSIQKDSAEQFKILQETLELEKDRLVLDISVLQGQLEYLRKMEQGKIQIALPFFYTPVPVIIPGPSKENITNISEWASPSEQIDLLERQLALTLKKLNVLENSLKERDLKIARLTQQIVDISLNSSEQKINNENRIDQDRNKESSDDDFKSRLELGQKIIEEKNNELRVLHDQLDKIKIKSVKQEKDFNEVLFSKDNKLIELNGILEIYKFKLSETSSKNKEYGVHIMDLENQQVSFQKKSDVQGKVIEDTKQDLIGFQKRLINVQDKLLELQKFISLKDSSSTRFDKEISDLRFQLKDIDSFLANRLSDFENHKSPQPLE